MRTSKKLRRGVFCCITAASSLLFGRTAYAQLAAVTAHMELKKVVSPAAVKKVSPPENLENAVIWLIPLDHSTAEIPPSDKNRQAFQLVQKNKSFQPHLLVVPVGSTVDFPNHDPFFHNVFSLFDGKRFDLGLYEAGATNSVRFDRVGVSFLFCNIHPEMSAVVVAVDTLYYGKSDRFGNISIPEVPEGKYELHVWYERSLPEGLKQLTRAVTVSFPAKDLGTISVPENPNRPMEHKNKYGQDYTPPPGAVYPHR